ncbi:MAG TPA: acyl carrier protein [Stellaceae bacterium]|nr:acyl carrier protein [Stellaceae bacterium]
MMTEPEILDTLQNAFRAVFADDQMMIKPETEPKDLPKWDSYHFVDIILRLEEQLGIKIRAREANKTKNVGDLIALISTKLV